MFGLHLEAADFLGAGLGCRRSREGPPGDGGGARGSPAVRGPFMAAVYTLLVRGAAPKRVIGSYADSPVTLNDAAK